MKHNNKFKLLFILTIAIIYTFSSNIFASNIITVDEMMFDEPIEYSGASGGSFSWDADGKILLDNYDGGSIRGNGDLEVIVKGDNKIICSPGEIYGLSTQFGNLIIKGEGTLTIEATEKTTWSSAIYISVDNEDKTISIDGVDIMAKGAFAAIEAHVEDYDRDGNIKSGSLNINNSNVSLSGTNAVFICGDNASINLSHAKVDNPNNNHIVDFYFNDVKTAKVFSHNDEDMKILESEYDANNNIDDLKIFLSEYGMIDDITIKSQPINVMIIVVAMIAIAILVLTVNFLVKKGKKVGYN